MEAKLEKVGLPEADAWNKLHSSICQLIKFAKQWCPNYKLYLIKYSEDLESTVNEHQRRGNEYILNT